MPKIQEGLIVRLKRQIGQNPRDALGIVLAIDADGKACTIAAKAGEVTCPRDAVSVLDNQDDAPTPRKLLLPYGTYTRDDGSVTIFNREYHGLWEVAPDGSWGTAVPWDRNVKGKSAWFPEWKTWPDAWRHDEAIAALNARLASYGIKGRPYHWEAIKLAVFAAKPPKRSTPTIYDMERAMKATTPASATLRAALSAKTKTTP